MHLVVGLGNPGPRYERSRHNLGFAVLDALLRAYDPPLGLGWQRRFGGLWSKQGEVALLKPETFMNASGESVQHAAAFLKLATAEIMVVHDELDLPFGEVRVKVGGGHAGHNGLRSLVERLGSPDFVRVRLGIGRPPSAVGPDDSRVVDWVLSDFDPAEEAELPSAIARAVDAVQRVVADGPQAAMNVVNRRD